MNSIHERMITRCPIGCTTELDITQYLLPEGPLLRCHCCGQLISQCSSTEYWQSMEEFDDPKGTLPDADSAQRRYRRSDKFLQQIAKHLNKTPQQIRLLDVGCSSGAFLKTAVDQGFVAEGVEPAPKAALTAQSAGLKVFQGLLQEANYADNQFDAVTLFEVIEHLPQPADMLQKIHRILKKDGILLIGTGNADSWTMAALGSRWEYLSITQHGGHISFFSPASIKMLAQRNRFEMISIHTRRVCFLEKGAFPVFVFQIGKLFAELSNLFAVYFNKGHDMAVYLRKLDSATP